MQIRNNTIRYRAFTLLELIVALALMDMIAIALYSSMFIAFKAKDTNHAVLKPYQSIIPAFEFMRNDLVSAMPPNGILAGVFLGENDPGQRGLDHDTLSFYTCSYQPDPDEIASNIINVRYGLENDIYRNNQVVLKRYINKNILAPNAIEPEEEIICRNIIGMDIRYYDGTTWLEEWDSSVEDSQMPWAVQITLTIEDLEHGRLSVEGLRHFTRIFMLPTANQEMTGQGQQGGMS